MPVGCCSSVTTEGFTGHWPRSTLSSKAPTVSFLGQQEKVGGGDHFLSKVRVRADTKDDGKAGHGVCRITTPSAIASLSSQCIKSQQGLRQVHKGNKSEV